MPMTTVRVKSADRMIISVKPTEGGVIATFADGCNGTIPFRDLPEVGSLSCVGAIELPNPYEVIITTTRNETVELPWDFVRHYCDSTYRPRMELIADLERQTLSSRVRELRESAGHTQKALAQAAGIARITLVRLENGKHPPKLDTLRAVAAALERPVEDLLAGADVLEDKE